MAKLELLSEQVNGVQWPELVSMPDTRVVFGQPTHSTIVISDEDNIQLGFWRGTPGAFTTDHAGYLEFVYIVEGSGRLVADDGTIEELSPGKAVVMPFNWVGRWEIEETITKVFSIVRTG
jgi:uncharacterized cupin superfamily protein